MQLSNGIKLMNFFTWLHHENIPNPNAQNQQNTEYVGTYLVKLLLPRLFYYIHITENT
jgi:hypothetical protein